MKTVKDRHGIVHQLVFIKQSELQFQKTFIRYICRSHEYLVSDCVVEQGVVDCLTCLVRGAA